MQKRLYRSRRNRMIFGVAGGLADYFGIDPIIVRLAFVLALFFGGLGFWAYIILAIVVPSEGSQAATPEQTVRENVSELRDTANQVGQDLRTTFGESPAPDDGTVPPEEVPETRRRRLTVIGVIILVLGLVFLMGSLRWFWWFQWDYMWPVILIFIGVLILVLAVRRR